MSSDSGPTNPPGTRVFSAAELAQFDGKDDSKPVYLAIKGVVFDVTKNRAMYAPGQGYSVFAGKDASKALGKSSLKPEDCAADYSSLNEEEMGTLNKWDAFYRKKYDIGRQPTDVFLS
ncbi:cytochrome b5-like heme/steroid binding domain-containing protein [Zopfochytrium polystomum]|nr:cytochrome b5-like heme/steroid binding domain-containing protein [Zopfochytrium polystomum]